MKDLNCQHSGTGCLAFSKDSKQLHVELESWSVAVWTQLPNPIDRKRIAVSEDGSFQAFLASEIDDLTIWNTLKIRQDNQHRHERRRSENHWSRFLARRKIIGRQPTGWRAEPPQFVGGYGCVTGWGQRCGVGVFCERKTVAR